MKIRIKSANHAFVIPLPTNLLFSRGSAWVVNHMGRQYSGELRDIPPEAVDRLFAEFRRIKRKHGQWTLVEVCSAGGDEVTVTL